MKNTKEAARDGLGTKSELMNSTTPQQEHKHVHVFILLFFLLVVPGAAVARASRFMGGLLVFPLTANLSGESHQTSFSFFNLRFLLFLIKLRAIGDEGAQVVLLAGQHEVLRDVVPQRRVARDPYRRRNQAVMVLAMRKHPLGRLYPRCSAAGCV